MRGPSFKALKEESTGEPCAIYCEALYSWRDQNPLFFKFYWWIFHKDSPCEGGEFLDDKYRLTTKKAIDLMQQLDANKQTYFIYNHRFPRLDPENTPFDMNSERWKGSKFVMSFADDEDEEIWRIK